MLKKLFGKKEVPYHYCIIQWSDMAKEYSVGYNFMKRIFYVSEGYVYRVESFYEPMLKSLRRMGIRVFDMTRGQEVPDESLFIPTTETALGAIQLYRRVQ